MSDWIAVDWGTTRLRAYRMTGTTVRETRSSEYGMGTLNRDGYAPALLDLTGDWLCDTATTVVACGMVGSRQGWIEAPYTSVPAPPLSPDFATPALEDPRLSVHVIPGLSQTAPPDVMRGEETQIAGVLAAEPDFDGVICLPGTHTKWAQISAGEVVSFRTAMTGEMFSLLSDRSVLRHTLSEGWDDAAFTEAVSDAISRPEALALRLFSLRAAGLLTDADPVRAYATLSGLLIGAELAATRAYWLGNAIAIVGAPRLAKAYAQALRAQGAAPRIIDGETATTAGLAAARAQLET